MSLRERARCMVWRLLGVLPSWLQARVDAHVLAAPVWATFGGSSKTASITTLALEQLCEGGDDDV